MDTLRCSSCDKQKAELLQRDSKLLRGTKLYMCRSCIDSKLEPRWIIIVAGRSKGSDFVRDYIVKGRYLGEKITAEELMK